MLAAALAATLALTAGQTWDEEEEPAYEEEAPDRVSIWGFAGGLFDPGQGRNGGAYGGEISYAFDAIELGAYGAAYEVEEGKDPYTPVVLLRLIQRFPTHRGLDAHFALGVGAARVNGWDAWFQVALGLRLDVGPAFLGGEFSFEQNNLMRLVGGVGVRF